MPFKEKILPTSKKRTPAFKIFQYFKELIKINKNKSGTQIEKQSRNMKRQLTGES